MDEILTPFCPLCDKGPVMVFGFGAQAWCGNDDCTLLVWDMTKSLDDNLTDAGMIQLPPGED